MYLPQDQLNQFKPHPWFKRAYPNITHHNCFSPNYIGKGQGKSATDVGAPMDTDKPKGAQFVITEAFDRVNKIRKGEGKKPITLTSVVDAIDLQRLGIDADKANALTKEGKSIKGAIKDPSKKGDVARLAPKTKEDYKRKPRLLEGDDSQPA